MAQTKISILSTRPLANPVMVKAANEGVEIDVVSFIETRNIIDAEIGKKIAHFAKQDIAAVFTSMNAAEAVIDFLSMVGIVPDWTIYSLGGITGTILEQYFGESEIVSDAKNATELAETVISDLAEEVVFFCGNQRRDELPSMLTKENIKVNEVVVYETIETPVKVNKNYNGILFFSPSAVNSFFSVNKIDSNTVLFAIGKTTAVALKKFSQNKILVADQPNKELLAEGALKYFLQ